ncbi:MAG: ABC transporter permease [Clostridia bacterium]|nr:ABC transporter permease [Clostridia bacterium]
MHHYKYFFKLLKQNRNGIIIYGIITIVMFIALTVSAKDIMDDVGISAERKSYAVSYVDNDNSELSKGLAEYLSKSNEVTDYGDKDDTEISNMVYFHITDYHMNIPDGFMDSVEAGNNDNLISYETGNGNFSSAAYDIGNRINTFLNMYRSYRAIGLSVEEAVSKTNDTIVDESEISIVAADNDTVEVSAEDTVIFNINQYYPYLILGMMSMGIGYTILITNKKETVDRCSVSPVPPYMTKLTNTLGLLTSGLVCWLLFTVFNFVYGAGSEIISNYGYVILINSFLTTMIACALSSLLTTFIKSASSLGMVTNIVSLSMAFLCGVFVPMRFIGENVLNFSKFLPFYWTILANNMTSSVQSKYSYDAKQLMICFVVEALFAVAISFIAIILNSKRIIKE